MKIPEPRRLSSGNYFIQLRLNGQSIPITAETRTECIRAAELYKAEHRAGKTAIKKAPRDITLREAMDKYITKYGSTLSPSTLRGYKSYSKTRFKAYHDKKLSSIDWQKMINEELAIKSEKTVMNAWGLVSPSLKLVGYPVPEVHLAAPPVNEIAFLQPEEIKPFCEAVRGRSYEIPLLMELHGLRMSELLELTWDKIDLQAGMITIKGATVRGPQGYVSRQQNKNRTSTRTLPIMIPQLHDALKAAMPEGKEAQAGKVVSIHPSALLNDVRRSCQRAKITEVTNHGLRHSFASLLFYLEIPDRQIQEWGGWKDGKVLHRIYIRLATSAQAANRDKVKQFFS